MELFMHKGVEACLDTLRDVAMLTCKYKFIKSLVNS